MLNEIFLLYHEYEYGEFNMHSATKILGVYNTLQEAINAINRYWKIKDFNKLPKKYFKISKFIPNKDTWYTNGFTVSTEPCRGVKKNKCTKIYSEISIYGKTNSLINDLSSIVSIVPTRTEKIGDVLKSKRLITDNLWEFRTKTVKTYDLSKVSNQLCEIFCNNKKQLKEYIIKNNCIVVICFVLEIGENGVCIDIDNRLIDFASDINSKIMFDGL